MENEPQAPIETTESDSLAPLKQVTPLPKYLAMTLFTVLPFVGGWIGYTYAPEKIVEKERVVIKEIIVENDAVGVDLEIGDMVTCGAPVDEQQSYWEIYTNNDFGFSIAHPPDFYVKKVEDRENYYRVIRTPSLEKGRWNFVQVTENRDGEDLEGFFEKNINNKFTSACKYVLENGHAIRYSTVEEGHTTTVVVTEKYIFEFFLNNGSNIEIKFDESVAETFNSFGNSENNLLDEKFKVDAVVNVPSDFKRVYLNEYNKPRAGGKIIYESEDYSLVVNENMLGVGLGQSGVLKKSIVSTESGEKVEIEIKSSGSNTSSPWLYFVAREQEGIQKNRYYVVLKCEAETCSIDQMESVFDEIISGLVLK